MLVNGMPTALLNTNEQQNWRKKVAVEHSIDTNFRPDFKTPET